MANHANNLSVGQRQIRDQIFRSATIRASIILIVGLVGSVLTVFYSVMPWQIAVIGFLLVAAISASTFAIFIFNQSRRVRCKNCRSDYSLKLTDLDRVFVSAVPRQQTRRVAEVGSTNGERYETSSWTEERYEVLNRFECLRCGDESIVKSFEMKTTGYQSSDGII